MPDGQRDYYQLLGVLRDATMEEIKRAYYEAAQRLHPDKNKLVGETELFLEVQQAYEVLSNPQRRAQYDATLPAEQAPENAVACKVQYSRPNLVHLNEPQLVYVLLDIGPRDNEQKDSGPPLNICLVLDRSTSMQGEKLDLVKAAATQIMRNLRPDDIFSIVAFSDRAEVIVPASYQSDRSRLNTRLQSIHAGGATEIYQGLEAGVGEVLRSVDDRRINHVILLTDGQTYGDEQDCLRLAEQASRQKIGISGFGIGGDWNDIFLDALAGRTGNNSTYIARPEQIQRLLVDKFEALTNLYAEDVTLRARPAEGIILSYAFRLQPESGPIAVEPEMHLGPILQDTNLSVLMEFMIQPSSSKGELVTLLEGTLRVVRNAKPGSIPPIGLKLQRPTADMPLDEQPSHAILDALARFTLYRLQERARVEAEAQDYDAATRHLKSLAARLLEGGQQDLAKTALLEAEQTERMQALSKEGGKEIKYGTRALMGTALERQG